MKLKWTIGEKPTGRFRSFHKRSWPDAEYEDGACAVSLEGDESYYPAIRETTELKIRVADYVGTTFHWRLLKARAMGYSHARQIAQRFIDQHHETLRDKSRSIITK